MSYRISIAAIGYFAVAGLFFAVAFTGTNLPGNGSTIAQAQEALAGQAAREARQSVLHGQPSVPAEFTATPKDSAS